MNAATFAATHGDSCTWTAADIEAEQNLAAIDDTARTDATLQTLIDRTAARIQQTRPPLPCWHCGTDDNPPGYRTCGYCNHHIDDAPTAA